MDAGYFSDSQAHGLGSSSAVSPASETPYQTPLLSASRRSSGRFTPSSAAPLTPPIYAHSNNNDQKHAPNGDHPPQIDANTFTESLHASLVTEILALRRELDSKHRLVEGLETSLSSSRQETEDLHERLVQNQRDARSVKRQLQAIEDSTLKAMEDVARERDEARATGLDLKRRLETSQQRAKSLDTESKKMQDMLDRERKGWDSERQTLQHRVKVAEKQLQSVVDEISGQNPKTNSSNEDFADEEQIATQPETKPIPENSPSKRHRRGQASLSSIATRRSVEPVGPSLADELNMDEDEDEASDVSDDDQSQYSSQAPEEERPKLDSAKTAHRSDEQLRRVPGIVSHFQALASAASRTPSRGDAPKRRSAASFGSELEDHESIAAEADPAALDNPANHGRKRDPILGDSNLSSSVASLDEMNPFLCGNCRGPLEPTTRGNLGMIAASTQTDQLFESTEVSNSPPAPMRLPPPPPVQEVPVIAIHPPDTRETSPRVSVLPPRTKSVGSQTDLLDEVLETPAVTTCEKGMQTEMIRIDQRAFEYPGDLTLENIVAPAQPIEPGKDLVQDVDNQEIASGEGTTLLPSPTLASAGLSQEEGDDEGEVPSWESLRKSLIFSGNAMRNHDTLPGNDVGNDVDSLDFSDDDYSIPTSRSKLRASKNARPFHGPPTPVPEDDKVIINRSYHRSRDSAGSLGSFERPMRDGKATFSNGGRFHGSKRSFLTDSTGHSRDSSLGSLSSSNYQALRSMRPPFAIPKRSSSRHTKIGSRRVKSDGTSSPTKYSPTRSGGVSTKSKYSRVGGRPPPLRKIRSTTAMKHPYSEESSLRSELTPRSVTFSITEAPQQSIYTVSTHRDEPRRPRSLVRNSVQQTNSALPTGSASVAGSVHYSVIDAITATMIGEWMFKYLRKRTSFGVSDDKDEFSMTSDSRHKRWVWLSPYERTIMWSSKQPNSNQALMGKTGRKLQIQSVLDVKDDTPPPKSAGPNEIFNRSIIILTPARALKLTATSRERHYLWLTALSFLAHRTSHGPPDLRFLASRSSRLPTGVSSQSDYHSRAPSLPRAAMAMTSRSNKSRVSVQSSGRETLAYSDVISSQIGSANEFFPLAADPEEVDTAFAPHVPRVPSRKRSSTNPSRGRSGFSASALRSQSAISKERSKLASSGASLASTTNKPTVAVLLGSGASSVHQMSATGEASSHYSLAEEPSLQQHLAMMSYDEEDIDSAVRLSADFGGNSSFFDAVGNVRTESLMGPGFPAGTKPVSSSMAMLPQPSRPPPPPPVPQRSFGPLTSHAIQHPYDGPMGSNMGLHRRNEQSQDSFIGPPNISRVRRAQSQPRTQVQREERKWATRMGLSGKNKLSKPRDNDKVLKAEMDRE